MTEKTPTIQSKPAEPPRRLSIRSLLAFAGVLTAILYGLLPQFLPDAPMRSPGVRPPALEQKQQVLTRTDQVIAGLADGHNVELHFTPKARGFESPFSTIYYHTNYALYPHQLLLGNDETIVNGPDQILSADVMPSLQWMKQHDVSAIITLGPPSDPVSLPSFNVLPLR